MQSGRSMSIYYTVTGHESGPVLCLSGIICRLVLVHPVLCRDELGDDDSKADSKSLRPVFGHPVLIDGHNVIRCRFLLYSF